MLDPPLIDDSLARRLIAAQFPEYAELPLRPVTPQGWDNRSFRLGEALLVRLPSASAYASQVDKEHEWLPRLAPDLPVAIPAPVAKGAPSTDYPWPWSIYRWIEGETAATASIADTAALATDVAEFLLALHRVDARGAPAPGAHNFHRGGRLAIYDAEARAAIEILRDRIDANAATAAWTEALATEWKNAPLWVHGDMSPGNLLLKDGRLVAVIDFGMLGAGDPACDLQLAWTFFDERGREAFRRLLPFDAGTWSRARGWALWKALITAAGKSPTNAAEWSKPFRVIQSCLA